MIRRLAHVAFGDALAKGLLLAANVLLIAALPTSSYAAFSLILTAVLLGYQLACAPLERLLIAQYAHFAPRAARMVGLFGALAAALAGAWLGPRLDGAAALLAVAGVMLMAYYQLGRIALQQRQSFRPFVASEVFRTSFWLVALGLAYWQATLSASLAMALFLAAAVLAGLSTGVWREVTALRHAAPAPASGATGRALWDARHVVAYSLLGALLSYLPMLLVDGTDESAVATYGAALRYQAVLGMAVHAFNTVQLPAMAAAPADDVSRRAGVMRSGRLLAGACAAYVLTVAAGWLALPLVDGGRYPLLPALFALVCLAPTLSFAATPAVNALLLSGHARAILGWMLAGVCAALVLHPWLAARSPAFAPALATVIAYVVVNAGLMASAAWFDARTPAR